MRLGAGVRSRVAKARRASVALLLGAAICSPCGAAPQHDAASDKVRIVYRAPAECPDEGAFLSAVRARTGEAWEASPGEIARGIEVTVVVSPAESTARLDFVDDDGHHVSRALTGASCADVVSAIALVTALAIDSRFAHDDSAASTTASPSGTETPPGPATPNGAAPAPNGTAPPEATPNASAPNATAQNSAVAKANRGESDADSEHRSASARAWRAELGLLGAVSSGVGPSAAFGGSAVAGLRWPSGVDLRIGLDYLTVPQTRVNVYGGVTVAMYELAGRASGCPLALPVGDLVRVSPCVGITSGVVHGETLKSPGVKVTGSGNPPFVAPFAEARVDFLFGALFLEASGEVRFVVDPPTFKLEPPDDKAQLSSVKPVAAFASLGLGLLL